MIEKCFRVGIAGYGVVGKRRKKCVDNHKNLKVTAVCDKNFEDSFILPEGIVAHRDYISLLDEDLDVLLVCLSNDLAKEVTIAGLQRGLHVFCEKPPGRNLEEIVQVVECDKANPSLKLMYGFNHRYHESVIDALKVLRTDELGPVINMRGVYGKSNLITFNQTDWRTKRKIAGGGVLLDQGIHMIDLMRLFGGQFEEVQSFISNNYWGFDVEDNAYALMRTKDGVVGMLHSSATQWRHHFQLEIGMVRGSIILGGILSSSKSYGAETLTLVKASPMTDNGDPVEQTTRYNHDRSWENEIEKFVDVILKDKPVISGSSEDAFETMKLVYKIYYADSSWRDKFKITNPNLN